jgi:hypothetical protein
LSSSDYSFTLVPGSFTVTQEDARAYYTGSSLFWAASTSASNATVTLAATIKDITAVDPTLSPPNPADTYPGDITKSSVSLVVLNDSNVVVATCPSLTPSLVNVADAKVGTVVCQPTVAVSQTAGGSLYTVRIKVGGYYLRDDGDDAATFTVALPLTSNFITGGGYLLNPVTAPLGAGLYAGDAGRKTNFGFNVKYNKSGTNLQGNVNVIVRKGTKLYQFKSNQLASLGVQYWNTTLNANAGGWALVPGGACANNYNASSACPIKADFQGKANLNDVTTATAVTIVGNLTLTMSMIDKGEPGSTGPGPDTLGITVYNGNSLWFSSQWNGTQTMQKPLDGGNLVAH